MRAYNIYDLMFKRGITINKAQSVCTTGSARRNITWHDILANNFAFTSYNDTKLIFRDILQTALVYRGTLWVENIGKRIMR